MQNSVNLFDLMRSNPDSEAVPVDEFFKCELLHFRDDHRNASHLN